MLGFANVIAAFSGIAVIAIIVIPIAPATASATAIR